MPDDRLFFMRVSCRDFLPEEIPEEDIVKLLEAAVAAPTGGSLQPWRFVVAANRELRQGLARAAHNQGFVALAPVVVAVCALPDVSGHHYGERGRSLYCIQDTAAAAQNLLLAATEMGYGSCWVGAFDEQRVTRVLDLPRGWRPVALIPLGRAASKPQRTGRMDVGKVTLWKY